MPAQTDAARPPAASLLDFDVTDCSSDSLFATQLLCGFYLDNQSNSILRLMTVCKK